MDQAITSMRKIERSSPGWLETRKILIGQATLLLGEVAILGVILGDVRVMEASIILLLLAHLWAWRQTVWRRQSIVSLIQTLREAASEG